MKTLWFLPVLMIALCHDAGAQNAPTVPSSGSVGTGNSGAVNTTPPGTMSNQPITGGAIVNRDGSRISGTNKRPRVSTSPSPIFDATGNQIPQPAPLSDPNGNQRR